MSVDPEQPELNTSAVPLRWGEDGPVIGSAIIKDNGIVEGVITDKKYVDVLRPSISGRYSVVDLNDLFIDSKYEKLFEEYGPAKFADKKTKITIKKKEETDGKPEPA